MFRPATRPPSLPGKAKDIPRRTPDSPIPRSALEVLPPSRFSIPLTTLIAPLPGLVRKATLSPGAKYPLGLHPGTCFQAKDGALVANRNDGKPRFPSTLFPPKPPATKNPQKPQEAKARDPRPVALRCGICHSSSSPRPRPLHLLVPLGGNPLLRCRPASP